MISSHLGMAERYAKDLASRSDNYRVVKSSVDTHMGKISEEVLVYLLERYFEHNNSPYLIEISNQDIKSKLKIVNEKLGNEKEFDVDISIRHKDNAKNYFLISCKGTARERIGQFLSNLFLMDDRLIKTKYHDRYYLEFSKEGIQIMYGFVCYDWAASKDFAKYTKSGKTEGKH